MCTKFDPFKKNRRIHYLREIFDMQTKNILNTKIYHKDMLMNIPGDEFENCKANEWFLPNGAL